MAYERHGLKGTREYNLWIGIKQRCYNKNNNSYKYYGAKGIKMCEKHHYVIHLDRLKEVDYVEEMQNK